MTRAVRPPVVSAIMATYNKGPWIQEAIDSLLAQTFTDWELILVNDASTDETAEVLARYSDPRIRIHGLAENVGRARARNVALGLARGRYIAVCDSDDISTAALSQRFGCVAIPDVDRRLALASVRALPLRL